MDKNLDTAFRMAKGIRAGTVWVNAYHSAGLPFMPYGYKQSGIGREMGHKASRTSRRNQSKSN